MKNKGNQNLPRVALVTNVLAHYRVPCFKELGARLPQKLGIYLLTDDMEHRRYVLAQNGGDLPITVLEGRRWRRPPDDDFHWNDISPVLRSDSQVWILGGWSEPTFLLLWLRSLPRRAKVLFWIESTLVDRHRAQGREWLKRLLMRGAAGCMASGQRAAEYCEHLGMPAERVFHVPNATDRDYFAQRAQQHLANRADLRQEFGLTKPTFFFVGRLVESIKGVENLIRATAQLAAKGTEVSLLLAGEGPDREAYASLAQQLGCPDVRFLGTLGHEELCRYYAAVDALALPSRSETWGFVLNEAMEFGLPLVVSDAVGAGPDLVTDNGIIVPSGDLGALTEALETLANDPQKRQHMGQASRRNIASFSPNKWADGAMTAIRTVSGVAGNMNSGVDS